MAQGTRSGSARLSGVDLGPVNFKPIDPDAIDSEAIGAEPGCSKFIRLPFACEAPVA